MSIYEILSHIISSILLIAILVMMFKWAIEAVVELYKELRDKKKNDANQSREAEVIE